MAKVTHIAAKAAITYKTSVTEITHIDTKDHLKIIGLCSECYVKNRFGLLFGAPGTGKTTSLERVQADNPDAVIITCSDSTTKKIMLVDTAEALGIKAYGSCGMVERAIIKELKKRQKNLLIYDEADFLSLKSLETIRSIFDISKCIGVVLCGNDSIAEKLLTMAEDKPELARLRDRIRCCKKLTGLDEEDAAAFLDGINCTPAAYSLLSRRGINKGIRQLIMALETLLDATDGDIITEDMVLSLDRIILGFNA